MLLTSLETRALNQNSNQNNVNQNVEQIKTDDSEHCDSRDHEKFKKCHLLKKDINKEKAEDDTTINLDLKFQKSSPSVLDFYKITIIIINDTQINHRIYIL